MTDLLAMARVLHIIDGIKLNTARWSLKMELEVYGKIDACHMGDRTNPHKQPPWVKFAAAQSAERCMEAIHEGKLFVNGYKIKAEYRKDAGEPKQVDPGGSRNGDLDLTSRDLFMRQAAGGGGSRAIRRRSPTRSRSRRRRRRRSSSSSSRDRRRDRRDRKKKGSAIEDNKPIAIEDNKPLAIEDNSGRQEPPSNASQERRGTCGHLLQPVLPRGGEIALVECDFCGQMQAKGAPMLCCRECEYDMCLKCADRAGNQVLD